MFHSIRKGSYLIKNLTVFRILKESTSLLNKINALYRISKMSVNILRITVLYSLYINPFL